MRRPCVGSRLLNARTFKYPSQNTRAGSLVSRTFSSTTCAAVDSAEMSPLSPESAVCIPSMTKIAIQFQVPRYMVIANSTQKAIARLRAYKPPPSNYDSVPLTRRAAVLILLYADLNGDLKTVLTIRAKTLSSCRSFLPDSFM